MIISIGFVRSASQLLIQDLDVTQNSLNSRIVDITDLPEQNLQALLIADDEHFNSMIGLLEKEKSYYPIIDAKDENLSFTSFESISPLAFRDLFLKLSNRWTVHQNFNSIENLWKITNHFRDLWKRDRLTFFEEFWYWFKRNTGTVDFSIIFNDVVHTEEKDENNEKKDRPKLVQSILSGSKKANFILGGNKEKELMQTYLDKFHETFEITEFNPSKGQFVATAQVERSPMIFMARMLQLNQLQRSLLTSIFNGLQ